MRSGERQEVGGKGAARGGRGLERDGVERADRSAREMISLALLWVKYGVSCGGRSRRLCYQASWLMAWPVSTVKTYGLSVSYWVSG